MECPVEHYALMRKIDTVDQVVYVRRQRRQRGLVVLSSDFNTNDDADDSEDNENKEEADPAFTPGSSRVHHSLFCLFKTGQSKVISTWHISDGNKLTLHEYRLLLVQPEFQ
jgi:hypothetical protein